ncbi:hypothetical protein SAMD00019534_071960 [Acytostelium subglobosum LB1]|uniref:hypothetical protein n=1 Tax=Acytostelium subglobosum LB1 TaxID=1410327 RepID=UPI0006450B60|nr:hypothetical protein SAMD00019534_071960 [Acytostelium subglobosum LB1]GAM24021.1 hypothetical protein SAMD00019534_071960 [Acytostelium subglobosum LB1]|eukprot:XP_012753057.1 hypothetical protein SAMD00019534_071960 [Acytostelium subglobosum LB1]
MISDRDSKFTAEIYQSIFKQLGTHLNMSTSGHAATDGQSEITNRSLKNRIKKTLEDIERWDEHLSALEFAMNTTVSSSTAMTPFKALYGFDPRTPLNFGIKSDGMSAEERHQWLNTYHLSIKENIIDAQNKQIKYVEKGRTAHEYKVGERVLVTRKSFPSSYERQLETSSKLLANYYGPFKVARIINKSLVEVDLPESAKRIRTFNVSDIKLYIENADDLFKKEERPNSEPNGEIIDGELEHEVERIINHRTKRNKSVEYLVKWFGYDEANATWETSDNLTHCVDILQAYNLKNIINQSTDEPSKSKSKTKSKSSKSTSKKKR